MKTIALNPREFLSPLLRCAGMTLALVSVLLTGCSSEITAPTELDIPAFALEGRWDGEFLYPEDDTSCYYIRPDGYRYSFECGKLLLGLHAGVTPGDLQDLFDAIDATFIRTSLPEPYTFASARVPMRTEREALRVASKDPRLRYASLNFSGPAECFMVGGCDGE
ncbi:MAG: hypothetical protein H0X65_15990 [Gemmatimonadetes bacterium]|nr:hypothetical protein [Gemmatimonadota bacterium]